MRNPGGSRQQTNEGNFNERYCFESLRSDRSGAAAILRRGVESPGGAGHRRAAAGGWNGLLHVSQLRAGPRRVCPVDATGATLNVKESYSVTFYRNGQRQPASNRFLSPRLTT